MSDDALVRKADVLRVLRFCDDPDIVDDIKSLPGDPVAAAAGDLAEAFVAWDDATAKGTLMDVARAEEPMDAAAAAYRAAVAAREDAARVAEENS